MSEYQAGPRFFEPGDLEVLDDVGARVRLILDGRLCYPRVELSLAFPLTLRDRYVGFRDANGKQIGMVADLAKLPPETRALLEKKLARVYFVPSIRAVNAIRPEFGMMRWEVDTDQGPACFEVQGRRDHVTAVGQGPLGAPSDRALLIQDVEGNRYRIPDVEALDPRSRAILRDRIL